MAPFGWQLGNDFRPGLAPGHTLPGLSEAAAWPTLSVKASLNYETVRAWRLADPAVSCASPVLNLHMQVGADLCMDPESGPLARPIKRLGI